jgi:hypothetical protein
MSKVNKSEVKCVDLFAFLGERLIRKIEERPIMVEFRFADGTTRTFEIPKKHPWHKELNRRRIEHLRASPIPK